MELKDSLAGPLSVVAQRVLASRYLLKDEDGEVTETFDDLVNRVAGAIADAEKFYFDNDGPEPPDVKASQAEIRDKWFQMFRDLIGNRDFLPNSPTLMNAGTEGGQLSACFVLPVDDDINAIFDAVKQMAIIFKSGGGVGLSMSRLRPKGAPVKSTGGVSSGPVSFMRVYNTTAEVVAQGGKRRGALMGTLRVDHPDILEFIKVKQDLSQLTSFNVSVAITDTFMLALKNGDGYSLVDPRTGQKCGELNARDVWQDIVECAWRTGEPGLIFLDRMNDYHKEWVTADGEIEGTNPCVTGDTWVLVGDGTIERVSDLVGKPCSLYVNGKEWATEGFFHSGRKLVHTVVLEHGISIRATSDHVFFRYDGDALRKTKLEDLRVGDVLPLQHPVIDRDRSVVTSITVDLKDVEDVYDVQVPGVNAFVANGILVGNCGEIPLMEYESCNLGSINLANFVLDPYTEDATIDTERLIEVVAAATRFLDNVITVNSYPLPQIKKATLKTRKVGLGVMGFADMLLKLGVRYGSQQSRAILENILREIHQSAVRTSEALAIERGTYPAIAENISKRRNGTLTAIAPTGSISMIADVTGGIEPMFALFTERKSTLDGESFTVMNKTFSEMVKHFGYHPNLRLAREAQNGSLHWPVSIPKVYRDAVVCAHQVRPEDHVNMQAAAQKWSDNATSKTVNLPNSAVEGEVHDIFKMAYDTGCKGITVYRDGCRENQPMNLGKTPEDAVGDGGGDDAPSIEKVREWAEKTGIELSNVKLKPKNRPISLRGNTVKMKTGCGTLFVTINQDEHGNVVELFAHHGKAGICSAAQCEAIGRLSSMSLRAGVDPQEVADQLRGITCHETSGIGPTKVLSCADGIAKAILHAIGIDDAAQKQAVPVYMGACPKCGAGTIREAGCMVCKACGWEKCS